MTCEGCGHDLPEKTLLCPSCGHLNRPWSVRQSEMAERLRIADAAAKAAERASFFRGLKIFIALIATGGFIWWFVYSFFYAPTHIAVNPPVTQTPRQSQGTKPSETAEQAVLLALYKELPYVEPRIEFLQGANLNIYLKRQEFESIPFPDRSDAVRRIGKAWCEKVEGAFLPAIKIRDIRTGEELAKYSCTTGSTSLSEHD